jgi:hypothetical protein
MGGTHKNSITSADGNLSLSCDGNARIIENLYVKKNLNLGTEITDSSGNIIDTYGNLTVNVAGVTYTISPTILKYLSSLSIDIQTQFSNIETTVTNANSSIAIFNNSFNSDKIQIGSNAGKSTYGTISIGLYAGNTGQNNYAVAIGNQTGQINQGLASVAIGLNAGHENQGSHCIAIGDGSGYLNQPNNSFYVSNQSVRNITTANKTSSLLSYNPTDGEIMYSNNILDASGNISINTPDGLISPTELSYLLGCNYNIYDQFVNVFNNLAEIRAEITDVHYYGLANLTTFAYNVVINGTLNGISNTIYSYLSGLTSNIQTSIDDIINNVTINTSNILTNTSNISTNTSNITTLQTKTTNQTYSGGITTFTGNLTVESPINFNTGCGMYGSPSNLGNCNTNAGGSEKIITFPSYGCYRVLVNNNSRNDNRYQLYFNVIVSFKFLNITAEYAYTWWVLNNYSSTEEIGVSCGGLISTAFSVYLMKLY